jgi:hypothetical protein
MRLIRPRKLLAFAYWELRRTIIAISGKEWADGRAMALLVLIAVGLTLTALSVCSIIVGREVIPLHGLGSIIFIVGMPAIIVAFLNFEVKHKNRWKQFEREFEGYSKFTRTIGGIVMIALPFITIAAMIWFGMSMSRLRH